MSAPIQIRMGGYGPPTTSFSLSLKRIGDRLEAQFGDAVKIDYVWNIMDLGYRGEKILDMVEHGILTLGYQSSSYLTDRVPELGFVDLPFLMESNEKARAAIDGSLGLYLTQKIEDRINYKIFGYFENGFRHVSNKLRPIHTPADMKDMSLRVLPSDVQARTFNLLGAEARRLDLTEAIDGVVNGTLDAQENPLANTVTYGVHKFHKFHTLTNHFYISRPIFCNRTAYYSWPEELRIAMQDAVTDAVTFQRGMAEREAVDARKAIEDEGCEVVELTAEEHQQFVDAVKPQHDEAREQFGDTMFEMLKEA